MFERVFEVAYEQKDDQKALFGYEAILSFPLPVATNKHRDTYVWAINNAINAALKVKDVTRAKALADRGRSLFKENPFLTHSCAGAYVAAGDLKTAFECAAAAVRTKYEHLDQMRVDKDLGPLLRWPEFIALFEGPKPTKATTKAITPKTTARNADTIKKATPEKKPTKTKARVRRLGYPDR
jgi:hypothetical protein